MTKEKAKNKSGAGKFFLGALLGGVAGAIAGKFMSDKTQKEDPEDCECKGECKHCETKDEKIKEAIAKISTPKESSNKKLSEKKEMTKKPSEKK